MKPRSWLLSWSLVASLSLGLVGFTVRSAAAFSWRAHLQCLTHR